MPAARDREITDLSANRPLEVGAQAYPSAEVDQKAWIKAHQSAYWTKVKIDNLAVAIRSIHSPIPKSVDKIRTETDYFETNAEQMRYPNSTTNTFLSAPA